MIENNTKRLKNSISSVKRQGFDELALAVFRYQAEHNEVYRRFLDLLGREIQAIRTVREIPFLPVSLFKNHDIQTGAWVPQTIYTSSGTTGTATSRHLVLEEFFYLENAKKGFEVIYGDVQQYLILALLPSYLERQGSSLIAMMQYFIAMAQPGSGFYLNEYEKIISLIVQAKARHLSVLLLGVSFALLDFAEQYPVDLEGVFVMETGGMKGKRKELIREDLHDYLKKRFQIPQIHSEYGMTELFSQAYAPQNGVFYPAPTMKVLTRPINDPLGTEKIGKTGLLNIIDLANIDSCSFIATEDLGIVNEDGSFTVSGRADNSDIRGCNLLIS